MRRNPSKPSRPDMREENRAAWGVGLFFLLALLLLPYDSFYPTQLLGPIYPLSVLIALGLAGWFGWWFMSIHRRIDTVPQTTLRDKIVGVILFGGLSVCVVNSYLWFGLDLAEHMLARTPFAPKQFVITHVDDGRGTRYYWDPMIEVNPYGLTRYPPVRIAIPRAQYDELDPDKVVGQCITVPARKALFAAEQIRAGCLSVFCTHPRAEIAPCAKGSGERESR